MKSTLRSEEAAWGDESTFFTVVKKGRKKGKGGLRNGRKILTFVTQSVRN